MATREQCEGADGGLPVGVAYVVAIIYFRLALIVNQVRPRYITGFPRIRRLIDQPKEDEKLIIGVKQVISVQLHQFALDGKRVSAVMFTGLAAEIRQG